MSSQPDAAGPDSPSRPIRVLIANLPGLLAELVAQIIGGEQDLHLVAQTSGALETLKAAEEIDVVVLGDERPERVPALCTHLLNEYPSLRVLVVSSLTDDMTGYWLGLRSARMDGASPERLVASIRHLYEIDPAR